MTGEITLRGRVLPVGGIKEKILGAVSHGLKRAVIPSQNAKDLEDIPADLRRRIDIHTVDTIGELLSLVLNCLYALSKLDLPEPFVKSVFELRAACLAGYTPDLYGCHICGSQRPDRFDLSAGQLECHGCRTGESNGIRMPVTPAILEAMRYISLCDPKKLFAFQIGQETQQMLSALTEAYLSTQLERGFSALDFYKSLLI